MDYKSLYECLPLSNIAPPLIVMTNRMNLLFLEPKDQNWPILFHVVMSKINVCQTIVHVSQRMTLANFRCSTRLKASRA